MSEQIGKQLTCDRCGETIFLPWEGTQEFDVGYSKVQHFAKKPEGWTRVGDVGDLCPACSELYRSVIQAFKTSTEAFVADNIQRHLDILGERLCQNQSEESWALS